MDPFDELVERVRSITGLNGRQASAVAAEFDETNPPAAGVIAKKARELGFEIAEKPGPDPDPPDLMPEITMDPAQVLAEVYENCPRVLMANFPSIGRAPNALEAIAPDELKEEIDQLPDEIKVLLAKINLADEKMTVWLRDEANDVDRPIGPIDLRPYQSGERLHEAIMTLLSRLPRVLRADSN